MHLLRSLLFVASTLMFFTAIAVGFVGALVVIRPTGGGANPFLLLVVGNSACYAIYQLLTRKVSSHDRAETSVAYSALLGTLALSLVVPFVFTPPERLWHWGLLASLGLLGAVGHYCVARALTWGPASIVSPFHYVQLVGAATLGYAIFGDVPTRWTWAGAAIIVASGLYLAWREARRPRL